MTLSVPPVTGNITGTLYGTVHETNTKKAPSACGGNSNCDKSFDFTANEGLDGSNPAALLVVKSQSGEAGENIIPDLLTFSDQDAECESLDPDDTGFLVGDPTSFAPKATDALAASAVVPLSELKHFGKIIISVHKTAFNYPTPGDDNCSNSSLGLTSCSHSQMGRHHHDDPLRLSNSTARPLQARLAPTAAGRNWDRCPTRTSVPPWESQRRAVPVCVLDGPMPASRCDVHRQSRGKFRWVPPFVENGFRPHPGRGPRSVLPTRASSDS